MLHLFIYFLKKDIKSKYVGSGLGVLWAFVLPLFQIFLFWFVFASIMKVRPSAGLQVPYLYFLLSSFFFWLAFSESVTRATHVILENAEMVKKVSFPNVMLPLTVTASSYIHHLIGFVFFMIVYVVTVPVGPILLLIIPVLLIQIAFSAGLGLMGAALLPYARDIGQVLGYVLQGVFFLSPVMYSVEVIPKDFETLVYLNPFTHFALSYQRIILSGEPPELYQIGVIFSLAAAAVFGGAYVFGKLKDGFADVL
jgi:ABC-type polysaccharide/polyol phosphate export permease